MANLIPFPEPDTEAHAQAETERKRRLFAWADALLQHLGLTAKVAQAQSIDELRKIALDIEDVEIEIAIRDALHPVVGARAEHFTGMRAGMLKRLLKARFSDMKKNREAELLGRTGVAGGRSSPYSWTNELKLDAKGGIRPNLANLTLFLREHPTWKGVIGYDEFSASVVIQKRPYWGEELPHAAWTDHHESLVRIWFEREDIAASQGNCGKAIQAAARANCFNPVRDYLDACARVWDGKPRIDAWLSTYVCADDTPYTRAIGPRWLISGVARIYEPGCKVDYVLVLESQQQGKQKSEALRVLAVQDAWFTDRVSHVNSKDAAQEMAGVWLIEFSELEALLRATASTTKAFITRRSDRYRPPYGKHTIRRPRQSIFAGTINPPVRGYLRDATGSRRIWPVYCDGMIDLEALARDRDQLWAEAVVRYRAGAKWHLETPELEAFATAEQDARFETDVWQERIVTWLGNRKETSVAEILECVFGLVAEKQNRSAQMRVAAILDRLHFTKYRPRKKGDAHTQDKRPNRYWRE
jgi:predicted P-loop ATPase